MESFKSFIESDNQDRTTLYTPRPEEEDALSDLPKGYEGWYDLQKAIHWIWINGKQPQTKNTKTTQMPQIKQTQNQKPNALTSIWRKITGR